MGYSIYNRLAEGNGFRYTWEEQISLAGCNSGLIGRELKKILQPEHKHPIGWQLPIIKKYNDENLAVLMEIKPNSDEVFFCEVDTIFGFCYQEWTPIMFRLKTLIEDVEAHGFDKGNFFWNRSDGSGTLYTMTYLSGSIENGNLKGKWTFPGPSSTNGLLFWPEAMSYFYQQVQKFDPEFLMEEVGVIEVK